MMHDEELMRIAQEVAILVSHDRHQDAAAKLERFAAMVAVAEREACETIAQKELGNTTMLTSLPPQSSAAWNILADIRARGKV